MQTHAQQILLLGNNVDGQLVETFCRRGYAVACVSSLQEAQPRLQSQALSAVVLDGPLDGADILEVLLYVRDYMDSLPVAIIDSQAGAEALRAMNTQRHARLISRGLPRNGQVAEVLRFIESESHDPQSAEVPEGIRRVVPRHPTSSARRTAVKRS